MTIKDYVKWLEQRQAQKNLSDICLKQKHKTISKEISEMLGERG